MTGTAAAPAPYGGRPRPDVPPPPSATVTRFALLAVTVVAASTLLHGSTLFMAEEAFGRTRQEQQTACADTARDAARGAAGDAAGGVATNTTPGGAAPDAVRDTAAGPFPHAVPRSAEVFDPVAVARDFESCVHGMAVSVVLKTAALVLFTCAVAVALYLAHARRARTGTAVGLDRLAADPRRAAIVHAVRHVLADTAAPASVTVVFAPLQRGRTGRCVGFPGRYRIVLSLALAVHHEQHPHLLPGVLRHELAHVRNRDIGITQLTIALWWAFLATVALPALLASLLLGPLDIRYAVAETAVALLLLWFERAAVLRARELLADAAVRHPDYPRVLRTAAELPHAERAHKRAPEPASTPAPTPIPTPERTGAPRILRALRRPVTPPLPGKPRMRIPPHVLRWLSYHPDWALREHRVAHPAGLLSPSLFEAGAAGILVGFGYQPLSAVVNSLWWALGPKLQPWLIGTCYAVLLSGILGLAVWRAVWRSVLGDGPPARTFPLAAAATAGILTGQVLLPLGPPVAVWRSVVQHTPLVGLVWGVALLVMVWGFAAWQALTAEWWLASEVRPRPGAVVAALLVGPPLLGYLLGLWFFDLSGLLFSQTSGSYLAAGILSRIVDDLTIAAMAAAVMFAAAPWVLRRLRRGAGRRGARLTDVPVPAPRWWVVGLCALAVIPAFLLAGEPLQAELLAGLQRLNEQAGSGRNPADGQSGFAPFLPVGLVGAGCIALAGLAVALTGRGTVAPGRRMRGRFPLLLLGAAAAAPGAAPMVLVHAKLAICGWSDIEECWTRPPPLRDTVVFGRWMLLCGVYVALVLLLLIVTVRFLLPRRVSRAARVPDRTAGPRTGGRMRAAVLRCVRGALVGCGTVAAAASCAALIVGLTPPPVDADQQSAARAALRPYLVLWPGTVPWDRACWEGRRRNLQVDLNVATDQGLQFWWAGTVTVFGASDDPGLVALAVAGRGSLLGTNDLKIDQVLTHAEMYCAYRFQERGAASGQALPPPRPPTASPPART
ncbi:hypothetical protein A6A06_12895 [Streptomyces sp. CB02923]|uniref:M48 family metalloprotease n=1 Tax=Streptomyces sp. CB02923 TaxID=1718985 RepID=UPI00093D47BC|nr:M48 family metalloprotease [Streptomyces sp. CB02923]OKI02004.1 hypothetical protein A6A06_12895 [Streptomyces sp. CB02923]